MTVKVRKVAQKDRQTYDIHRQTDDIPRQTEKSRQNHPVCEFQTGRDKP